MATINVRNLSFTYPLGKKKALDGVSFDVSSLSSLSSAESPDAVRARFFVS